MKKACGTNSVTALALCLLLLSLSGCASTPEGGERWHELELDAPSENVLWAIAGQELQRLDFPVGSGADQSQGVMRSGWRTSLGTFRGDGHRERAEVRFERLDTGRYRVLVRVECERNMDWTRPSETAHAQWESAPDDQQSAQVLGQRIQARLPAQLEVGPAPKSRR
jgi:hypothetical protein